MTYVITELCTLDASCVEVCPVACIHSQPDAKQYYIDPDVCIECEQCQIVCPVEAIAVDWKLSDQYLGSIEVNANFFRKNKALPASVTLEKAFEMVHAVQSYAEESGLAVSVDFIHSRLFICAVPPVYCAKSKQIKPDEESPACLIGNARSHSHAY